MPNFAIEHTYTRTDVYYAEAGSAKKALKMFHEGLLECDAKDDSLPETVSVFAADEHFNYGADPITKEVRDA